MNRLRRVGLTNRLVALLAGLLVVSGIVVGVATTIALRDFLIRRLDQQLAAAGVRYSLSLEHPDDDHDADNATFDSTVGQAAGTLGARLLHGRLTSIGVVDADSDHPGPTKADRTALASLTVSKHPRTVALPGLGAYRVSVQNGRDGDVLITGLPMRGVDESVGHLVEVEVVVFAVVTVLASLVGAGVIRRGLGPLAVIASAAHDVSALPLGSGSVVLPRPVPNPRPESEIGAVTSAFNLMLAGVQAALEQRHGDEEKLRLFIADASHELRTPVAVIASQAEYAERAGDDEPEAVEHALSRIRAEASRMGRLVDDLLLLAKLDLGRSAVSEPVDVTRIVLDAVADASRVTLTHRWHLDLPEDPVVVRGDPSTLHQAVANLLANAGAHTPPGTTVRTSIRARPDEVDIEIDDDGPGIDAQLLPHVLERFARADASRARTGGAGLGLAITDGIVRAHHGTLTVRSRPGATSFVISLPTGPVPPKVDAATTSGKLGKTTVSSPAEVTEKVDS